MKRTLVFLSIALAGCFPDLNDPKIQHALHDMRSQLVREQVDRAVAHIELYKLRHGEYPDSLQGLDTLNGFNPTGLAALHYARMDSGYTLDLREGTHDDLARSDKHPDSLVIIFPAAYWQGLGCRRSNLMPR